MILDERDQRVFLKKFVTRSVICWTRSTTSVRRYSSESVPYDEFTRNESPIAAVCAVVAIIAHSKKVIRRNHDFVIVCVFLVPIWIFVGAAIDAPGMGLRRKEDAEWMGIRK